MTNLHAQRVADTVRAELARRRLTQAELAEHLHTNQANVSRRLTGQVPFDVVEISIIAEWFGVPPAQLLGTEAVAQ